MESLFDEPEVTESTWDEVPQSTWREVPQARFLSWSDKQQLIYCRARDLDAVSSCESLEEAEWFTERARMYEEMIDACR